MACISGTNIVNDGLVFYFDLENGVKSFKGKPTSNLAPNTDYSNRVYNQEYDIGGWGGDDAYVIYYPNGGWNNLPYKRMTKTADGTGGSYTNEHDTFTLEEGKTYTISCYMRSDRPQTNSGHVLALNRSSTNTYFVPASVTLSGEWERKTWTHTVATGDGHTSYLFRQIVYTDMPTDVYWCALQIEEGTIATKYVNGIRLDTASIIDLSPNKSTITAANLTYRQDDTPMFDGTDDYLSTSQNIIKTTGGWTVETWFKLDAVNSGSLYNFIGDTNITYNSWYWTVFQSKLALWNRSPGTWRYGSTIIQPNTWYCASIVSDDSGTQYQFYLNGIAEGGDHTTYSWAADYAGLQMGYIGRGSSVHGRYFYGQLPSMKVYNRALTVQEIQQNFEATRSRYGV